jgi:hypothetical protein
MATNVCMPKSTTKVITTGAINDQDENIKLCISQNSRLNIHDSSVPFKVNPKPNYALVCRVGQKDKLIVTEQLLVQF